MKLKNTVLSVSALMLAGVGSAFAEVPASVTTSLTSATADVATVGGLAFAVIVAAAAFKYMRRAL